MRQKPTDVHGQIMIQTMKCVQIKREEFKTWKLNAYNDERLNVLTKKYVVEAKPAAVNEEMAVTQGLCLLSWQQVNSRCIKCFRVCVGWTWWNIKFFFFLLFLVWSCDHENCYIPRTLHCRYDVICMHHTAIYITIQWHLQYSFHIYEHSFMCVFCFNYYLLSSEYYITY